MSALEGIDGLFAACGGRVPVRVSISSDGREGSDERLLEHPFLIVGRSPQCEIRLDDPAISHRHAYIQPIGRQIFCADLGSRTGVRWPDGPQPAGWLAPDEQLQIGRYSLKLSLPVPDEVADSGYVEPEIEEGDRAAAGGRADVMLRFLNARFAADRSRQWRIGRNVTLLGHLPTCHIPLNDGSVSRVHASLLRTRFGLWVIDLLGKDGIDVNGQRVPFSRLVTGDVLRIGRFRMSVEQTETAAIVETGRHLVVPESTFNTVETFSSNEPTGRQKSEGLSEEFVMSMLNQSASMQQQMLSQQNQMILLTMQMLSSLHNQNIDLVRDELDYVRALTEEIQQIQAKLVGDGPKSITGQAVSPSISEPSTAPVNGSLPANSTGQQAKPSSPSNGIARANADRSAKRSTRIHSVTKPAGMPPVNGTVAKLNGTATTNGNAKPGLDGTELQSHLAHRLAELERKRSGYWQRIVRVVMG